MQEEMLDYRQNTMGHVWRREDGVIDIFGYGRGIHNGPICEVCGYGFCHHCQSLPDFKCDGVESLTIGDEGCQE